MHSFWIDIETIPLPLEKREFMRPTAASVKFGNTKDPLKREAKMAEAIRDFEAGVDAGLDELQLQIAVIGYIVNDEPYKAITIEHQTEAQALGSWWSIVASLGTDCEIIGHNLKGFDGPMLVRRAWLNGVTVPKYMVHDLRGYDPRQWRDTMQIWACGNRQADMRSLKDLCGAFGIPVKEGEITGATFAEWWDKDKAACLAYNEQDVHALKELWSRIGQ